MEHSCKQGIKGISTAIALLPRPGATATGHAPLPAQVHGRGSRRPVVPEPNAVQVTGIQVTVAVRTVRRCRRLERPKERRVDDGGVNSRQNCDRAKPNPTSMQHHAHDPRRTAEYRAGPIISLVGTRLTGVTERTSTAFARRASPATLVVSVCGHRPDGRRALTQSLWAVNTSGPAGLLTHGPRRRHSCVHRRIVREESGTNESGRPVVL